MGYVSKLVGDYTTISNASLTVRYFGEFGVELWIDWGQSTEDGGEDNWCYYQVFK